MLLSRKRRTRMVGSCTGQMLWHGLLKGLSSGGRHNLHPETNWISQSWSDHPLSEGLFPFKLCMKTNCLWHPKVSAWNVLANFRTVVKMPVKDMISCKLAHVCATPHCNSNTPSLTNWSHGSLFLPCCCSSWTQPTVLYSSGQFRYEWCKMKLLHWRQLSISYLSAKITTGIWSRFNFSMWDLSVLPLQQLCFDFPSLLS